MRQIVYADVLVFLNTVVTFFLLLTVKQFAAVKTSTPRLITASFVGGVYSLVLLAPKMHFLLLLLAKTAMSVSITLIAFHVIRGRKLLRCLALFLGASFLYAGIMYALSYCLQGTFVTVNNGAVYYDISVYSLIGITALVYGVLVVLRKKVFRYDKEDLICTVKLTCLQNEVTVKALVDSGHNAKDVYTGRPVVILAREQAAMLAGRSLDVMERTVGETGCAPAIRLLPLRSLSGEKLLPAFTAESVEITGRNTYRLVRNVSVAVTDDPLGGEKYEALIGGDLI